ncbi:GNAT family N-acetyltransferase [Acrocarpospora corrugata]|nr:GNAT family N-acetyltransferase [Acrocarpospora corrugata]
MRKTATGPQGVPVISYLEGVRDGLPWADMVEVLGPEPGEVIMSQLVGWVVSVPVELGTELVERGARLIRHAHTMHCELTQALPPADSAPPPGIHFAEANAQQGEEMVPAWTAAYPPGHPDHHPREEGLGPLLRGETMGKLLPCSTVAVDESGAIVAGVLVNLWHEVPWISDVFRHPAKSPRGLGARLLRHAQLRAMADGLTTLGLAVSYANPAKRVYTRLGFIITDTSMTVIVDKV